MERDLLPWILGGALITTGAIAAALEFGGLSSSPTPAPPSSSAPAAAPVLAAGAPAKPSGAAPTSMPAAPIATPVPAAAGTPASASAPPAASVELPAGEVWQCIVNGQKIFSDKRCGNGASVRQIGDLNVMDVPAAPQAPYGVYRSGYGGAPYPSSAPYPDDQDDTGSSAGDVYGGPPFIVARERARREHSSRQDNHVRPSPNRGASGSRNPH
jgi:hypothetical protein